MTFPTYEPPTMDRTAPFDEHPSLSLHVSEEQRDRAAQWLNDAYAEGRLSSDELDRRIGVVMMATNRRDLNRAFLGLVEVPTPARRSAHDARPYGQAVHLGTATSSTSRAMAAMSHFGVFVLWLFAPLLVFLTASSGSYQRREAAKSFNFQLIALVALIAAAIVSSLLPHAVDNVIMPFVALGWLLGTVIGGAKAAQGEDWTNPVRRLVRLEVLSEK